MNEQLKKILASVFDLKSSEITTCLTKDQIHKWDSLTHMDLITLMEREFNIEFSMEEIIDMTSVQNILTILEKHGKIYA